MHIVNPATEEVIATIATDDGPAVSAGLAAAKAAQSAWAARDLQERIAIIEEFGRRIQLTRASLAATLSSEMGKPLAQADGEIRGVAARIAFFVDNVRRMLEPRDFPNDGSTLERVSLAPLGVIGNISAWNYPWFVGSNVFVPALLTGNAVLHKPSEITALTGREIGRLLHEAGVPRDVFRVLLGGGEVGQVLLSQPLDGVFFTGSRATGERVAAAAAKRLIPVQLELGGKDPAYVCEDVDVPATAAALAEGAFYNSGQSCCAVERIYVHQDIYEDFLAALVDSVSDFVVGDPTSSDTFIGPLARKAQLEVLQAQVDQARAAGARVLLGGKPVAGAGYYFAPTVVADATNDLKIMRQESFGPIIGVMSVGGDEQAIELMNDTEYGLTASVFCRDRRRAEGLLARVASGTSYWNCCDRVSPQLPWSGVRASGLGATLGDEGIRAFLRPRAWHLREPQWPR